MKEEISFRKTLFWDVDLQKLDFKKDAPFVIGRVLDLGNLDEWKMIKNLYGIEKIKKVAQEHIFSDARSANFWAMILNITPNQLKCMRKPLLKTPNAFLKR